MEVIHNTGEDKCTISVIHKEVYHDEVDGEVTSTTIINADKRGHVEIRTITDTNDGRDLERCIPFTLSHVPILSKMLAKVTEELGKDIQKYTLEGEQLEKAYLKVCKWTLDDIESLFELAGVSEDFCTTVYDDKIVCGGWNRVYLYPDGTVKVSGSHSRLPFLEVANQLGMELT
jgi:hypothetical protein